MSTNSEIFKYGYMVYNHLHDYEKGIEIYKKAVNTGNSDAAFELGFIYQNNFKNMIESIKYYEISASLGHNEGIYNLALIYKNDKNYKKALELLHLIENLDKVTVLEELAHIYYSLEEFEVAAKYYNKCSILADTKNICTYAEKDYSSLNYSSAIELWKKAASLGDIDAMLWLGDRDKWTRTNYAHIPELALKAAKLGNPDGMFLMGKLSGTNESINWCLEAYIKFSELDVKQGDQYMNLKCILNICSKTSLKYITIKELATSVYRLKNLEIKHELLLQEINKAGIVIQRDNLAHYDLNLNYDLDLFVAGYFAVYKENNINLAIKCLSEAVEKYEHIPSMILLGDIFMNINKDLNKALEIYTKIIAIKPIPKVLLKIGFIHYEKSDRITARNFFEKAAELSDMDAIYYYTTTFLIGSHRSNSSKIINIYDITYNEKYSYDFDNNCDKETLIKKMFRVCLYYKTKSEIVMRNLSDAYFKNSEDIVTFEKCRQIIDLLLSIFGKYYQVVNFYILEKLFVVGKKLEELEEEIKLFEIELEYRPEGNGALLAKTHFQSILNM